MRLFLILIIVLILLTGLISATTLIDNSITVVNDNIKKDCTSCHKKTVSEANSHFIESSGDCEFCHIRNNYIDDHQVITIKENEVCVACHVEQDAMNSNDTHHELYCVDCHNPHGSNIEFMFQKTVVNLCKENCHTDRELGYSHPVGGEFVDKRTGDQLTCISTCHSLHSPSEPKLMQYANGDICYQCHSELW